MDLQREFIRILNHQLEHEFKGDKKKMLDAIRRNEIGVYRDYYGKIHPFSKILKHNGPSLSEDIDAMTDNAKLQNFERIKATALHSQFVIGYYKPRELPGTLRTRENETRALIQDLHLNLKINEGLNPENFVSDLNVFMARINIVKHMRVILISTVRDCEISSVFYQGKPNSAKEKWQRYWRAVRVPSTPDSRFWAPITGFIQFAMAVGADRIKAGHKHQVFDYTDWRNYVAPAINGAFAWVIFHNTTTYDRIVKMGGAFAGSLKRVMIGMPPALLIMWWQHPTWGFGELMMNPDTWFKILVIGYMDKFASHFMTKLPWSLDAAGLAQGSVPEQPPKWLPRSIGEFLVRHQLRRDKLYREIPAILRNIPKYIGYSMSSTYAATIMLLSFIPVSEFIRIGFQRVYLDGYTMPEGVPFIGGKQISKPHDNHKLRREYEKTLQTLSLRGPKTGLLDSGKKAVAAIQALQPTKGKPYTNQEVRESVADFMRRKSLRAKRLCQRTLLQMVATQLAPPSSGSIYKMPE